MAFLSSAATGGLPRLPIGAGKHLGLPIEVLNEAEQQLDFMGECWDAHQVEVWLREVADWSNRQRHGSLPVARPAEVIILLIHYTAVKRWTQLLVNPTQALQANMMVLPTVNVVLPSIACPNCGAGLTMDHTFPLAH